jgi:DNA-binding MarR family transcriptional regulator
VPDQPRTEQLNAEIQDCVVELTGRIIGMAARLAQRMSIPPVFIKALHLLDGPTPMKDLGKRMDCDPSFVTSIADLLEKHGLARREAHPGDRRIKNLILTSDGRDLKRKIEAELANRMPWSRCLSDDERAQLLALFRKMLRGDPSQADEGGGELGPGDLAAAVGSLSPGLASQLSSVAGVSTPPVPGEVNIRQDSTPAAH